LPVERNLDLKKIVKIKATKRKRKIRWEGGRKNSLSKMRDSVQNILLLEKKHTTDEGMF